MFKEYASKAFKFIGAAFGVLVAAWTVGWSGAITLHALFKTERIEAQAYVEKRLGETSTSLTNIHNADIKGINRSFKILIGQTNLIIGQNRETKKAVDKITP